MLLRPPTLAMVSLLLSQKTVGFEPQAITVSNSGIDSGEDGSMAFLKKPLKQLKTRHRLKDVIGEAVKLHRRNTLVRKDLTEDQRLLRGRRLALMKGAGRKHIVLPKMADLVGLPDDKPIIKFRRTARAVLLLIQVCNVCKEMLSSNVREEPWFALIDNLMAKTTLQQKSKAPRAFVTFVPDEQRELVQLTFDVAEFKRERRTEFVLTDEIREMMSLLPGYRTPQQVAEIISLMKALFPFFCHYKLVTQKAIAQHAFFDKYKANRVIVKKGHNPDGIYFILSGCVVEKHEGGKHPVIINAGEKFGEADLLCGARRRHTVLTKVDTEIFYLHRQDYRVIFDLSEDRNNPKNLDICKQHVVFQHFPMQRLVDNPGMWSVHNYKYGQLIALDGNNLDWIYVLKSGEARVFKYLQPNNINLKTRRRKVQAMINSESSFYRKKRILNFVGDREYIKSAYRPAAYHPAVGNSNRNPPHSAPPSSSLPGRSCRPFSRGCVSLPATRPGQHRTPYRKSSGLTQLEISLPRLVLDDENANTTFATIDNPHQHYSSNSHPTGEQNAAADSSDQAVIIEGLHDLSEDEESMRSLSATLDDPPTPDSAFLRPDQHSGKGTLTTERQKKDKKPPTHQQRSKSEVRQSMGDSTEAPRRRLRDRRISADLTGSLFEGSLMAFSGQTAVPSQTVHPSAEIPENDRVEGQRSLRPSILVTDGWRGGEGIRGRSASFLKTPATGTCRSMSPGARKDKVPQVIQVGNHTLPAFVQVETLHPGQVFGLRACLDPEERGPSVSLVSGDCEVLQINKKFFMSHCDEAIYSLIRLKNKPFPSEEDLIDRLDVNMQWEEYKQHTLNSFLKQCRTAKR